MRVVAWTLPGPARALLEERLGPVLVACPDLGSIERAFQPGDVLVVAASEPGPEQVARVRELRAAFKEPVILVISHLSAVVTSEVAGDLAVAGSDGILDFAEVTPRRISFESRYVAARRDRENRWQTLLNASPNVFMELDLDGTILWVSAAGMQDAVGRDWLEFAPAQARTKLTAALDYVIEHGKATSWETEGASVNRKESAWYQSFLGPVFDDSGNVARLVLISADETDRHQAQKMAGMLFEASPCGFFLLNRHNQIVRGNVAVEECLGYHRAETVNQNILKYIEENSRSALVEHIEQAWSEAAPIVSPRDEIVALHKTGHPVMLEVRSTVVRAGIEQLLITFTDVSERRRLESNLRESQKMEAIGRLAGGIAHDFNNILTGVMICADLIRRSAEDGEPVTADIREILEAAESASELTKKLVAFSRRQVMQPVVLDVNELIREMYSMLNRLLGEHIEIKLDLIEQPWLIQMDRSAMQQILLNLAINARDAMPSGGQLILRTRTIPAAEAAPGMGDVMAIEVVDTGEGMSEEVRSHIFEPYFTTKRPGKGSGLGLATCYGLVKQVGGTITAQSVLGKGTRFEVRLLRTTAGITEYIRRQPSPTLGGSEVILLVEDEERVRAATSRALNRLGYRVLQASSGEHALAIQRLNKEPIDLLVTDVVMPGMSGPELAGKIVITEHKPRVLFVSGYPVDLITAAGLAAEDVNYVAKPYSLETLGQRIRAVLDAP